MFALPLPNVWSRYVVALVAPMNPMTCIDPTVPFSTLARALKDDEAGRVKATFAFVEVMLNDPLVKGAAKVVAMFPLVDVAVIFMQ